MQQNKLVDLSKPLLSMSMRRYVLWCRIVRGYKINTAFLGGGGARKALQI